MGNSQKEKREKELKKNMVSGEPIKATDLQVFIFNTEDNSKIELLIENHYKYEPIDNNENLTTNYKLISNYITTSEIQDPNCLKEFDFIPSLEIYFKEMKNAKAEEKYLRCLQDFLNSYQLKNIVFLFVPFEMVEQLLIKENDFFFLCQFLVLAFNENETIKKDDILKILKKNKLDLYKKNLFICNYKNDYISELKILLYKAYGFVNQANDDFVFPIYNKNTKQTTFLYKTEWGSFQNIGNRVGHFYQIDSEFKQRRIHTFNILICGKAGAGKSSFINSLLGDKRALTGSAQEITKNIKKFLHKDYPIAIYDTPGFSTGKEGSNQIMAVNKLINDYNSELRYSKENFHAIIYLTNCGAGRCFSEDEKNFYKSIIELNIPIFFVCSKPNIKANTKFEEIQNIKDRNKKYNALYKKECMEFKGKVETILIELYKNINENDKIWLNHENRKKFYFIDNKKEIGFRELFYDIYLEFDSYLPKKENINKEEINKSIFFRYINNLDDLNNFYSQKAKEEVVKYSGWLKFLHIIPGVTFGEDSNSYLNSGIQKGMIESISRIYGEENEKEIKDIYKNMKISYNLKENVENSQKIDSEGNRHYKWFRKIAPLFSAFGKTKFLQKTYNLCNEAIDNIMKSEKFEKQFNKAFEKAIDSYQSALNGFKKMSDEFKI